MKKIISLLLVLASLSLLVSCGGEETETRETFEEITATGLDSDEDVVSSIVISGFSINIHSSYAEITGYTGTDSALVLPDSAAGMPIMAIGESAFDGNEKITSVTFGKYVKEIFRYAFRGTTALNTVIFNDGLEIIGDWAFYKSGVETCIFPDSVVTIEKYAFQFSNLKSLTIPANCSKTGKYAFANCEKLESVTFSARFSEIADSMFSGCKSLKLTEIPDSVTEIGTYAFKGCTSLTEIKISKWTETVGEGAFHSCDVTITAESGTAAAKYAEKNGFTLKSPTE